MFLQLQSSEIFLQLKLSNGYSRAYLANVSTCRHSPTTFVRTRQTRRHLPKAIFFKNVTCLAKFARVLSESGKFETSENCLIKIQLTVFTIQSS